MPKKPKRLNLSNNFLTLIVRRNGIEVDRVRTRKLGRFSLHLQAIDFSQPGTLAYIHVLYQPKLNNLGKMTRFHNDGEYDNKKELLKAYHAFIET